MPVSQRTRVKHLVRLRPNTFTPAPDTPPFRAFADDALWNIPAAEKGTPTVHAYPDAAWLDFGNPGMVFGGLAPVDWPYRKAIYFCDGSEATTTTVTLRRQFYYCPTGEADPELTWVSGTHVTQAEDEGGIIGPATPAANVGDSNGGGTYTASEPIPIPDSMEAATGSDGHLCVVSADLSTAWDMWEARQGGVSTPHYADTAGTGPDGHQAITQAWTTTNGFRCGALAKWDLTGPGYSTVAGDNSARGSGTPLLPTTLRAHEAAYGIQHALHFEIPGNYVLPTYVAPASKSDGNVGTGNYYGQLFVLNPAFSYPPNSTRAVKNIIDCLKEYGMYLVDRGTSFEIATDGANLTLYSQIGLAKNSLLLNASDFLLVT